MRLLRRTILLLLLPATSAQAAAGAFSPRSQYGYGYGYGFGYAPPIVMMRQPSVLIYADQYYDVSVDGIRQLCGENGELCASEAQQAQLTSLRHREIWSYALGGVGLAALVAAPLVIFLRSCDDIVCRRSFVPAGIAAGAGLALTISAAIVRPGANDCVAFVNGTNRLHPDSPIKLQISVDGHGGGSAGFQTSF